MRGRCQLTGWNLLATTCTSVRHGVISQISQEPSDSHQTLITGDSTLTSASFSHILLLEIPTLVRCDCKLTLLRLPLLYHLQLLPSLRAGDQDPLPGLECGPLHIRYRSTQSQMPLIKHSTTQSPWRHLLMGSSILI